MHVVTVALRRVQLHMQLWLAVLPIAVWHPHAPGASLVHYPIIGYLGPAAAQLIASAIY